MDLVSKDKSPVNCKHTRNGLWYGMSGFASQSVCIVEKRWTQACWSCDGDLKCGDGGGDGTQQASEEISKLIKANYKIKFTTETVWTLVRE